MQPHLRDVAREADVVALAVVRVGHRAVAHEAVALLAAANVASRLRVERRRRAVAEDGEDAARREREGGVVPLAVGERRPRRLVVVVPVGRGRADGEPAVVGAQEEVEVLAAVEVEHRPVLKRRRARLDVRVPAARRGGRVDVALGALGGVHDEDARVALHVDPAVVGAAALTLARERC